jgi:hypothetical protein
LPLPCYVRIGMPAAFARQPASFLQCQPESFFLLSLQPPRQPYLVVSHTDTPSAWRQAFDIRALSWQDLLMDASILPWTAPYTMYALKLSDACLRKAVCEPYFQRPHSHHSVIFGIKYAQKHRSIHMNVYRLRWHLVMYEHSYNKDPKVETYPGFMTIDTSEMRKRRLDIRTRPGQR